MFKTYKCHLDSLWLFSGNPFNMIHGLAVSSGTTGFGTDCCIHRFGMRVQAHFLKALYFEVQRDPKGGIYEEA